MAFSGFILAAFVFVHMAGNLQMFAGPDAMNAYAHMLQTLPYKLLWVSRIILLAAVGVHTWMAILLTLENRRARPQGYRVKKTVQASAASRTMGISGSIVLFFIFFHIGHFTLRIIFPHYQDPEFYTMLNGEMVYNVYKMVVVGFSQPLVSAFYIVAMAFLCLHLSHGVSSMFQSLGIRNRYWKACLDKFAIAYGWIIFIGFIAPIIIILFSAFYGVDWISIESTLAMSR